MEYIELFSHQFYRELREEILGNCTPSTIFPEEYVINKIRKYLNTLNSTTRLNINFFVIDKALFSFTVPHCNPKLCLPYACGSYK